jgi:predicted O-methyltransferase YrrM
MNINFDHINQYLNDIYIDDDFLDLKKYALENDVPIMKLETKEFLKSLIKMKNPKTILEIGTAIGYSSLIFDKYSKANIVTIEKSQKMSEIAEKNFEKYAKNNIHLINMDAVKALDEINQGFDFIFIDANKAQYKYYFDIVKNKLNDDGIIVCDNVLFRGEISNDNLLEKRHVTIVKRLRKFLSYITYLEEFHTSIIPIGDGITISIRRKDE